MKHPTEFQLALLAGGDLGLLDRWTLRRHLAHCASCSREAASLTAAIEQVRDNAAELPPDLNWNRLAEEMTGNIRVGLAAGEAIAGVRRGRDRHVLPRRLGWNAGMVLAGASLVFAVAFWLNLPPAQADHLAASFKRIRTERIGNLFPHAAFAPQEVVLEASSSEIGVKENGQAMTLLNPHSDAVTVSISMKGTASLRYVDAESGQVTTNKVYYAEQ